jgi:hypothetical protein
MSWFLVGGAALGAGVGSYGHDNWGWSKDAIWQGALVGGAGGYAAGGLAGAGAAGAGTAGSTAIGSGGSAIGSITAGGAMPASMALPGASTVGAGAGMVAPAAASGGGLMSALTTPLVPGLSFTSPMMLGAAGLSAASASSAQGPAFQDKIKLTEEGKVLQKEYLGSAKERLDKAKAGDVTDRAFQDISNLKTAEGKRKRVTSRVIDTALATIDNQPRESRGTPVAGGSMVKAGLLEAGERMEGLFAPSSILNSYRKEELINASRQIQNLSNIDNQVGAFNYSSSLAKWSANQQLSAEKGAAYGGIASMFGSTQLNQAYLDQMKIA